MHLTKEEIDVLLENAWHDAVGYVTHQRALKAAAFWNRMDRSGGLESCWTWHGSAFAPNSRYPDYKIPRVTSPHVPNEPRVTPAYRVAYIFSKGPIPPGMTVDHICFNPMCCNPAHLQLLTRAENSARKDPSKKDKQREYKHPRYKRPLSAA